MSSISTAFDPEFYSWMEDTGDVVGSSKRDGLPYLVFDHGEKVFRFESLEGGWFRVTSSTRRGAPHWWVDVPSFEAAQVFVSVRLGNAIRRNLGLLSVELRENIGREKPGVDVEIIPWVGPPVNFPSKMRLFVANGSPIARFGYPIDERGQGTSVRTVGLPSIAAGATWYIDQPLALVLESLRHPTGAPLFELLGDRRG